jgi:hypothetical protein
MPVRRGVTTGRLDAKTIARVRAVPIADEINRRGIHLQPVELELVGACPVCGDGGKGSRSNRFAVHADRPGSTTPAGDDGLDRCGEGSVRAALRSEEFFVGRRARRKAFSIF